MPAPSSSIQPSPRQVRQQRAPLRVARLQRHAVLHGAGRVVGREVQRLEVVPVGLDLGPLGDAVAEADEDVDDLVGGAADRVDRPAGWDAAGQGDVDALGLQQRGGEGGLQVGAGLVAALAALAARVGVEAAMAPLGVAERRAPGEVGLLCLVQGVEVAGGGDGGAAGGHDRVQIQIYVTVHGGCWFAWLLGFVRHGTGSLTASDLVALAARYSHVARDRGTRRLASAWRSPRVAGGAVPAR